MTIIPMTAPKKRASSDSLSQFRQKSQTNLSLPRRFQMFRRMKSVNQRRKHNGKNDEKHNSNENAEKVQKDPIEQMDLKNTSKQNAQQWVDIICKKGVSAISDDFTWFSPYPIGEKFADFQKYKAFNRYEDIFLLEKTRVLLKDHTILGEKREYINASYVDGVNGGHNYICTQGPTDKTPGDFWSMVWQEEISCIVMLGDYFEGMVSKCVRYYPDMNHIRNFMLFSEFMVTRAGDTRDQDLGAGHVGKLTELELIRSGCAPRTVYHLQYKEWESETAPKDSRPILNLITISNDLSAGNATLVQSSSGTGRAGVYVLIDMCLIEHELFVFFYFFSLFKTVHVPCLNDMNTGQVVDITTALKRLRSQRAYAVANEKQYAAVYRALLENAINKYNVPITDELRFFAKEINVMTK